MQHLDRCLEHLDELHQALVRQAQAASGVAVGVRVVLRELLPACGYRPCRPVRDVLVVLVARLGLRHADLAEHRRPASYNTELGDVTVEFMQAFDRPGRQHPVEVATRDAVFLFEDSPSSSAENSASGESFTGEPLMA